jgi:excinuclease UvrABC nuclease subunit
MGLYERLGRKEAISVFEKLVDFSQIDELGFQSFNRETIEEVGGVYRFFNENQKCIYVGATKNLKRRLASHLNGKTATKTFVDEIAVTDFLIIQNPLDRAMVEGILKKFHEPIHNKEVYATK